LGFWGLETCRKSALVSKIERKFVYTVSEYGFFLVKENKVSIAFLSEHRNKTYNTVLSRRVSPKRIDESLLIVYSWFVKIRACHEIAF